MERPFSGTVRGWEGNHLKVRGFGQQQPAVNEALAEGPPHKNAQYLLWTTLTVLPQYPDRVQSCSPYLSAWDERERRLELVLSSDEENVEEVCADNLDADEDAVVVDLRDGPVDDTELLDALEPLVHHHRLHRARHAGRRRHF